MNEHNRNYLFVGSAILALFVAGVLIFVFRVGVSAPVSEVAPVVETSQETAAEAEWQTATDTATGISFRYPEELSTTYIRAAEWPPVVTVSDASYSCEPNDTAGNRIRETQINGDTFCVTERGEGAAGSVFTEYEYRTEREEKLLTLAFTLRSTQCGNYDEAQMQACTIEREGFNPDTLAEQIVRTVEFN